MIVYLLTIAVAGAMAARAVLMDGGDCEAMARRMIANDPALSSGRYSCEALPMYFRSLTEPQTPSQTPPAAAPR